MIYLEQTIIRGWDSGFLRKALASRRDGNLKGYQPKRHLKARILRIAARRVFLEKDFSRAVSFDMSPDAATHLSRERA